MTTTLISTLIAATLSGSDIVEVSARLEGGALEPGGSYTAVVEVSMADGVKSGQIEAPILQIAVPEEIEMSGKALTSHRDLARNEFLQAPYEQLIENGKAEIPIMLIMPPSPESAFHFNVLAYVEDADGKHFVRKRVQLPLAAGATGKAADAQPSNWGNSKTLQLGDKAPDFELPAHDGSMVKLSDHLGKSNVIVTTYRAHW